MKSFGKKLAFLGSADFEKIVNSVVLVSTVLFFTYILSLLTGRTLHTWWQYLAFSPQDVLYRPWTLVTYAWVHVDVIGFLINLFLLYYTGIWFLSRSSESLLVRLFFAGVVSGSLGLWLISALFPSLFHDQRFYLTGVSAGYMAWLAYLSVRYGNSPVYIRLIGGVKIKHILFVLIAWDLLQWLAAGQPGGRVAHFSAVFMAGLYAYAEQLKEKKSSKGFSEKIYDNYKPSAEKRLDQILDKINRKGTESLTEEEREILRRESMRSKLKKD